LEFLLDDGINIPQSYTSYIAPMQSSKLYNEVRQLRDKDKHPLAHFETPYVVHLQNKYDIANPKPLFTFKHPNTGSYKASINYILVILISLHIYIFF
jgi:type II protein arginine methyltransferase